MSRLANFASSALAACSATLMVTWFAVACNVALADEQLSGGPCDCHLSQSFCRFDEENLTCVGACEDADDCKNCNCIKIVDVLDCDCEPKG